MPTIIATNCKSKNCQQFYLTLYIFGYFNGSHFLTLQNLSLAHSYMSIPNRSKKLRECDKKITFKLPLGKSVCCDFEFRGGVQPLSWQQTGSDRHRVRSVGELAVNVLLMFRAETRICSNQGQCRMQLLSRCNTGNIIPN